jgi:hypothetical protein
MFGQMFALVLALAVDLNPNASTLLLNVDTSSGAFNISIAGELWLRGREPTAGAQSLQLTGHTSTTGTHPALGGFSETRLFWATGSTKIETAFKVFADEQTVLFEQSFPNGIQNCTRHDPRGMSQPVLAFPDFAAGGRETELGAVTWSGVFSMLATSHNSHRAAKLSELPSSALGRANGGPVVVFDELAGYQSLIISPFDNFLASTSFVAPLPAPALTCGKGGLRACGALTATDVTGDPKVDISGKIPDLTREECCSKCTANPKCEAWARHPGAREDCWLVGGVTGTEPSTTREVGCPDRSHTATSTASTASASASWWAHGISGEVQHLPAGFTHSTILSVGDGLTAGLQRWGAKMRKAYDTKRNPDIVLSHLSYWTGELHNNMATLI